MKYYLGGEFFAEWHGPVEALAEFSGVDVSRLSPDVEELREIRRKQLKQERIERVNAPINNVQVATPEDRENVQWAASNVESVDWIMADNTVQTLTAEQLQAVIVEYTERKMQVFATYADLLQQLSESEDPESVVWPED